MWDHVREHYIHVLCRESIMRQGEDSGYLSHGCK